MYFIPDSNEYLGLVDHVPIALKERLGVVRRRGNPDLIGLSYFEGAHAPQGDDKSLGRIAS